jgi:hypothetical protein
MTATPEHQRIQPYGSRLKTSWTSVSGRRRNRDVLRAPRLWMPVATKLPEMRHSMSHRQLPIRYLRSPARRNTERQRNPVARWRRMLLMPDIRRNSPDQSQATMSSIVETDSRQHRGELQGRLWAMMSLPLPEMLWPTSRPHRPIRRNEEKTIWLSHW